MITHEVESAGPAGTGQIVRGIYWWHAVVAMGALSVALHEEQASAASGGAATGANFIQGSMTMGQTATTTTPPAAPATSVAAPPVKAPPYGAGG